MAGKLMQAVQYDGYGGGAAGLKHVELPVPSPKKEEVLIKLEAASINPVDWKIQKGMLRPFLPRKFPFVPETPSIDAKHQYASASLHDDGAHGIICERQEQLETLNELCLNIHSTY